MLLTPHTDDGLVNFRLHVQSLCIFRVAYFGLARPFGSKHAAPIAASSDAIYDSSPGAFDGTACCSKALMQTLWHCLCYTRRTAQVAVSGSVL